jgi:hypothetical protein
MLGIISAVRRSVNPAITRYLVFKRGPKLTLRVPCRPLLGFDSRLAFQSEAEKPFLVSHAKPYKRKSRAAYDRAFVNKSPKLNALMAHRALEAVDEQESDFR